MKLQEYFRYVIFPDKPDKLPRVMPPRPPPWHYHTEKEHKKMNHYLEAMAAAYIKMTDIPIEEAELVQRRDGYTTTYYFRRRAGEERE